MELDLHWSSLIQNRMNPVLNQVDRFLRSRLVVCRLTDSRKGLHHVTPKPLGLVEPCQDDTAIDTLCASENCPGCDDSWYHCQVWFRVGVRGPDDRILCSTSCDTVYDTVYDTVKLHKLTAVESCAGRWAWWPGRSWHFQRDGCVQRLRALLITIITQSLA